MNGKGTREQPWLVRLTHWLNVPLIGVMALSGLQVLVAFPYMGPRGAPYGWYPLQGWSPPGWLRLGGWLAGARALHFGVGLFFVVNGALYLGYLAISGEWRRRLFWPRRDLKNAAQTVAYYLRVRKEPPPQGLYNGLQRAAYTSSVLLGGALVLSGLAIYKPVQFPRLTWSLGGYDGARLVHFAALAGMAAFTLAHVTMVALHPRSLWSMLSGGRRG
jgi:thiosulfate reductase cytochrome b subunit